MADDRGSEGEGQGRTAGLYDASLSPWRSLRAPGSTPAGSNEETITTLAERASLPRLLVRSTMLALLGAACGVPPLAGQAELEVATYEGLYWPTSSLATGAGGAIVKHQSSRITGWRVTLWAGRVGIEGTTGSAPSDLWSSSYGGVTYPAFVRTNSIKARLRVTPPAARAAVQVGGGVGWVRHHGYAFDQAWYLGPWNFTGGIANVGALIKLVRWVGVRFEVEDFVYSSHLGGCTRYLPLGVCDVHGGDPNAPLASTGSTLQHDLVLSLGIAFVCCRSGSFFGVD